LYEYSSVYISIKNNYVDLNDIGNPIKQYTTGNMNIQLLPTQFQLKEINIDKNEVVLQDNWM